MCRSYGKKEQQRTWSEKDMVAAVQAAKKAQMTVYGAAKYSQIPRKKSRNRVTGKVRVNAKAGQKTILAKNEEVESVETFQILALLD